MNCDVEVVVACPATQRDSCSRLTPTCALIVGVALQGVAPFRSDDHHQGVMVFGQT